MWCSQYFTHVEWILKGVINIQRHIDKANIGKKGKMYMATYMEMGEIPWY